ncbi:hypothetical protein [Streptomyces sp. NPDC002763]|uniref:hypothetical protein n=1 Tax=Streptomyces sp. NPDC002763 TaxID=3154427 RepID=UPI00332AD94F
MGAALFGTTVNRLYDGPGGTPDAVPHLTGAALCVLMAVRLPKASARVTAPA